MPVIPDIKRANRCHSSDLKLDIAQKFDRNDDYLAVTEAELQKARSRWLQITRQLKTAVFAGGAGELFSGSPWMETPCDEETALLNALEACNYTASLFPISTLFSQTCEILEVALGAMVRRPFLARSSVIAHLGNRGIATDGDNRYFTWQEK